MKQQIYSFHLRAVPKPRMTRRDKWIDPPRPPVARYRAFSDDINLQANIQKFTLKDEFKVIFYLAMPTSWSKKKKDKMRGKPHQQKPDASNLLKALEDVLRKDDEKIWNIGVVKLWEDEDKIVVIQE